MAFILLPEISPTPSGAILTQWLVGVGAMVEVGQPIAALETEVSRLIVEASSPGRIVEHLVHPGETVRPSEKLGRIEVQRPSEPPASRETKEVVMTSPTYSALSGKAVPLLMPQAGNTMEEGTVVAWHVKEGDQISVGQVICEIETDKATMDFESPEAGRIARIIARIDEPVAVKNVIALLADRDEDADAYLSGVGGAPGGEAAGEESPARASRPSILFPTTAAPAAESTTGRIKASPAARRLAAERNLALSSVGAGSGPGGRILSLDLKHATRQALPDVSTAEIRRPISKMRRAIGLNLQKSKQTVPHFYVRTTINADALLDFYRNHKHRAHCSLNDIIVLAVGRAMIDFPAVRSQIDGNEIVEYPHSNIGIAVGIDDGLVVPVVLDVDTLSLDQLAAETKRIVEQARTGRLENVGKGHFTISNLGMFGVEEFSAIINPPESGILAVSAARETVIAENGAIRVGRQMTITLSADHRIVDGIMAAKFMQRLGAILENPCDEVQ